MALTGLDIYKLLPQTDCGDCGVPTCLAFAMKVANKQASIEECPHVSDDALQELGAASAPPQKLVTVGVGPTKLEIGNETVMFRHDERFQKQCGVSVVVKDTDDIDAKAEHIDSLKFERVGEVIAVNVVTLECESGEGGSFQEAAQKLDDTLGLPLVLVADSADLLAGAAEALSDSRPLLWEREGPSDQLIEMAADSGLPIVVEGDIETCDEKSQKAMDAGVDELVLCPGKVDAGEALEFATKTRRAALDKTYRPLGFPVLLRAWNEDPNMASLEATHYVSKYAGIVVVEPDSPEYVMPVVTMRQSVYIDPQVPVQVEQTLREANEPDSQSPLLITTNFSLTYYSVLSEVEASRVGTYILPVDTEGTSVLTAWAADKFGPEQIKAALEASGAFDKLDEDRCQPVIPGLVAVISGELEEEIGQDVIVGPKEAT
ncbi:MAG: acetyl-CoA decarbonylase/synthase complex subunit gamma, partial [Planctomycetes bacterium]|nr:acetyl-CoA decarbonylase/synthase complex subunit gamma [Planctomycetota bacterium]